MLHFLIYDVLGTPAILVGLFSLIGLLLQKKGISDVISGTLKTIMGFVILTAGAGIIAYTLTIFSQLFEHSFHIQGVVPNTDAMAALAQKNYGTETATPHGKSSGVSRTALAIGRTQHAIPWETMDGSDVRCVILFAVCLVDQNATHIRLLAQVSGSLADEDIIAKLLVESDPHKIIALFNSETENADA